MRKWYMLQKKRFLASLGIDTTENGSRQVCNPGGSVHGERANFPRRIKLCSFSAVSKPNFSNFARIGCASFENRLIFAKVVAKVGQDLPCEHMRNARRVMNSEQISKKRSVLVGWGLRGRRALVFDLRALRRRGCSGRLRAFVERFSGVAGETIQFSSLIAFSRVLLLPRSTSSLEFQL